MRHPAEAIDRIRGRFELAGKRCETREARRSPATVTGIDMSTKLSASRGRATKPRDIRRPGKNYRSRLTGRCPSEPDMMRTLPFARALVSGPTPEAISYLETGVARGIGTRSFWRHSKRTDTATFGVSTCRHSYPAGMPRRRLQSRRSAVALDLLRGSSRRRLPALLRDILEIDMFVHDSLHTETNMRFEFASAWPALRPSGILVSDDVSANRSFSDFVTVNGHGPSLRKRLRSPRHSESRSGMRKARETRAPGF